MSIDLDGIEAHWLGDIDATDPYQALLDMRADLAALAAELRATTGDLAVAVEVARERGEALAALRAGIEALRDEWRSAADAAFAAYPNPIGTRDGFPRGYASAQSVHADALDALLRGAK